MYRLPWLVTLYSPLVNFQAQFHAEIIDYDEAGFMELTPRVVHTFPNAAGR